VKKRLSRRESQQITAKASLCKILHTHGASTMQETLSLNEKAELRRLETVIERGINVFGEVGAALAEVQEKRLYRAEFVTFERYVSEKWHMTRSRAYQYMKASRALAANHEPLAGLAESAVRELAGAPIEFQRAVVERAKSKTATPTARDIAHAKREEVAASLALKTPPMPAAELRALAAQERTREQRETAKTNLKEQLAKVDKHMKDWPGKVVVEARKAVKLGRNLHDYKELVAMHAELTVMLAGRG
jgi:hypothetical protein